MLAMSPAMSRRTAINRADRIPLLCVSAFTLIWAVLAIAPRYRADWLLENLLTFICVPAAVLTYRRFRFSDRAYVQATIFLVLHTIGSHYTYSEVPLGDWLRDSFNLSRNHYDRLVHFAFGILMLRPMRELAIRQPARMGRLAIAYLGFSAVTLEPKETFGTARRTCCLRAPGPWLLRSSNGRTAQHAQAL